MFTSLGLVGQGNINECFSPTFTLAEPTPTGNVKISWQGNAKHNKYHVQYRKQGAVGSSSGGSGQSAVGGFAVGSGQFEWFEVYTYGDQVQVSNLQPGVTYEFRVGGTCHELTDFNQGYTYTSINTFTMPTADESVSYSCGIVPEINITNTTPLENLGVNETFTAGDFPVTVTAISPSPLGGGWEGDGFIVVPYLADTKIAVEFSGIKINTDYQLIDGVIQTTYDATWSGVESVDEFINGIGNAFNDLLDLLNNFDGSEAAQADLNDIINTINDQLESIEGNTAVTDDVKEQLSKLQENLNNNVQVLTDTDKNPTKENKDAVISSVQEIKEIADSLASQQNTGGEITTVGSDPYFDGVIQGTSTTGSILNESQATLTDNLQNFKSLEIPSGNDDEGNTVTNLKKTVGNFNVYASTSDISDTDFNAIKQNIASINGIGVWLHYSTESNEVKYEN